MFWNFDAGEWVIFIIEVVVIVALMVFFGRIWKGQKDRR